MTIPKATDSLVGSVVTTLATDGLRVRSEPHVGEDSYKHEPLLPLGTQLYVVDGPVSGSGYAWYRVKPVTSRDLPGGWVAAADREGEPWIVADEFQCPPTPSDFESLSSLAPAVGLVCFPGVPITVEARILGCNCDMDGEGNDPAWLGNGGGSPDLLVGPDETSVPRDTGDWFVLHLDPDGEHPEETPVGEVVQVTGVFDHPAASSCTVTEFDGEPEPTQDCRFRFAVTRLLLFGP